MLGHQQEEVLKLLATAHPLTELDIGVRLQMSEGGTSACLQSLVTQGYVEPFDDEQAQTRYRLPDDIRSWVLESLLDQRGLRSSDDGRARSESSDAAEREQEVEAHFEALYDGKVEETTEVGEASTLTGEIWILKRLVRNGMDGRAGHRMSERYQLVEPCGGGGWATVWVAYDAVRKRKVALRILHSQFVGSHERVERFFRGRRLMARLKHRNIVRVSSTEGRDDTGRPFFAMELLTGGNLWQAIQTKEMSTDIFLDRIDGIAAALAYMHTEGVCHGGVDPENILLSRKGIPKLTDFDLVCSTDMAEAKGAKTSSNAGSMSLGQGALTEAVPTRDVFDLAMTMVVGLLGRQLNLSEREDPGRIVGELQIDAPIAKLLRAALQEDEARRPADAGVFLEHFRAVRPRPGRIEGDGPALVTKRTSRVEWREGEDKVGEYADVVLSDVQAEFRVRLIKPGTFMMGSPVLEAGRQVCEGPRHEVTLSQAFWLADVPCTQAIYQAVTGRNPSRFLGGDRPVEMVSWNDVQVFIQNLSDRLEGAAFTLPTEAQWEYACRAGTTTGRYGRLSSIAWHFGNSDRQTQPVRQKRPNAWGLYDMLGNNWEWCRHAMREYDVGNAHDPVGDSEASSRALRGGSWFSPALNVRAASRLRLAVTGRLPYCGFRLSRD